MDELNTLVKDYQQKHGTNSLQLRELGNGLLILNNRNKKTVLSGITIPFAIEYLKSNWA